MKKSTLFLTLSVAANAALVVVALNRNSDATLPASSSVPAAKSASATSAGAATLTAAQVAALESGDVAALEAAGLTPEMAKSLSIGRAFSRLQAQMKSLRDSTDSSDGKAYWKRTGGYMGIMQNREQRVAMMKVQREFAEEMRKVFGEDAAMGLGGDRRTAFLPAAKREALSRIEQDYSEMQSEIYMDMNGIQLPSDREKMKLLTQEKEADMMAALSPEEYEQYQLRNSETANNIRNRYGEAIQSEEDYKKIFALQKAYDAQYNNQDLVMSGGAINQEVMAARRAAEQQLQKDVLAAIGEENFAAYKRANDQDYKALSSVEKRLGLTAGTADSVYASRDTYAAQSQAIMANESLSQADRKAQLQALAATAQSDLTAKLGAEGAEAYATRAQWMRMLKSGSAFSTSAKDAGSNSLSSTSSVYPVRSTARPKT